MISKQETFTLSSYMALYDLIVPKDITKRFFTRKNVRKAVYYFDEMIKEKFPLKPTSNEITEELDYYRQVVEIVET